MEQKWFSCLSLVFWIHVKKNVAPCVEVDLCCMACRGGGVGGLTMLSVAALKHMHGF